MKANASFAAVPAMASMAEQVELLPRRPIEVVEGRSVRDRGPQCRGLEPEEVQPALADDDIEPATEQEHVRAIRAGERLVCCRAGEVVVQMAHRLQMGLSVPRLASEPRASP